MVVLISLIVIGLIFWWLTKDWSRDFEKTMKGLNSWLDKIIDRMQRKNESFQKKLAELEEKDQQVR